MEVRQGDIFWVEIPREHTEGSEQFGRRPFIVVSRDSLNKGRTVVVVPMSTTTANQPPFRTVLPVSEITRDPGSQSNLELSVAKTDQVRVIDKTRLEQRIGRLSKTATIAVILGVAYVLDNR